MPKHERSASADGRRFAAGDAKARSGRSPIMIYRTAKRIVIFMVGSTVALIGIIMLITPGPALIVIPAGLAILATEFAWAAWLLKRLKRQAVGMVNSIRGTAPSQEEPPVDGSSRPAARTCTGSNSASPKAPSAPAS